jgi:hypothetical protein
MTIAGETFSPQAVGTADRGMHALAVATLAIWFGAVLAGAGADAFTTSATQPPIGIALAIAVPPLLFALLYQWSQRFREYAHGIDLSLLTAIQGWRVIGLVFLALYAFGLLPGLFAWPAGLGDVAVGLTAPFVLRRMLRGAPNWRRHVVLLNVAGLLDFLGAVGTGILTSNSSLGLLAEGIPYVSLGELPLVLVPAFAVPLWIIFHIVSLLQLRRKRE